jgi:Amt family ammonium transporter
MAGFSDFAGSTIFHSVGGWAALAGTILLGVRKGKYGPDGKVNTIPGSNLPMAALGTFILWMVWFSSMVGLNLSRALRAMLTPYQLFLLTPSLAHVQEQQWR